MKFLSPLLALSGVVAQVAVPGLDNGIGNLVTNLGVMGALVWHMWYHTTKTYPAMQDRFFKEISEARQVHFQDQAASRNSFFAEQKALREHCADENGELRNMLIQALQGMRTAVHDVRDTAQVAINKTAAPPAAPPIRWETRRESKDAGE